jgi:cell division septal protein FtsQ
VNPFKQEKGKIWKKIFYVLNITIVVLVAYFLHFFFVSEYFILKNIQVEGVQYVSTSEFLDLLKKEKEGAKFLGIPTKNLILFSIRDLRSKIAEQYIFSDLHIEKIYPDTLAVRVEERTVVYRMVSQQHEYLIDDTGMVVKKIQNFGSRPELLSLTHSDSQGGGDELERLQTLDADERFSVLGFTNDAALAIGQTLFTSEHIRFIEDLIKNATHTYYTLELIRINQAFPQHIEVTTKEGYMLIFNTNDPFQDQLKRLEIVVEQEVTLEKLPLIEYIDLRLGNNIYIKYK